MPRLRAVALAVAAAVPLAAASALPAAATGAQPFVIGGRDATENYSFMVSMQSANGSHRCGASLITSEWVVTAAHCVGGTKPADLRTRIGSTDRTTGGELVGVKEIVVHPDAEQSMEGNDVALMKLEKPVQAKPITIAPESGGAGTATRILGWGTSCFDQQCGTLPVKLQELDTKIVADNLCGNGFVAGKELCTDSDTPNAMGCHGDSGGPQLRGRPGEWQLVGATSRDADQDPLCATGNGIWSDVTAHRDWIKQHVPDLP
ncbi:S1 family peptidase [Amycolatopsis suaedae]|uniref:Serine protease n=1 Tax=Amycolatopsis suaedae TaxID=2510978 RepID=A0A4Q7J9I1_9PSEU|nr:serine protease [Amycolatopsis suaedae]RZQ63877.1 serine protease [Amycolatopsis suaedae]